MNTDKYKNALFCTAVAIFAADMAFVDNYILHYSILIILMVAIVVANKKVWVDAGDVLLIIAMFTFSWFQDHSVINGIKWAVATDSVYQIGKNITKLYNDRKYDSGLWAILSISVLLFVKGVINFLVREWGGYTWVEWPTLGGRSIPRTQHEFYLIMMSSLLIYWVVDHKNNKRLSFVGLIISGVSLSMGLLLEGRMNVCCAACAFAVVIISLLIENHFLSNKIAVYSFLALLTMAIVVALLFKNNVWGLHELYEKSKWSDEGGLFQNVRFGIMKKSVLLLKDYPFGNCHVSLRGPGEPFGDYAHNSWLDIGRRGGLIPLLATVGFTCTNVYNVIRLIKNDRSLHKYALLTTFSAVTIYNMFEPGIIAGPLFWDMELFLGGLAAGMVMDIIGGENPKFTIFYEVWKKKSL